MTDFVTIRPTSRWFFILLIALSLAAFAVVSYTAALTKSSTQDEPMHAAAGAVYRQQNDFRMDFDNPPLWLYWAELPNWRRSLTLNLSSPFWKSMTSDNHDEWQFASETMYHTPANDAESFVRRCRPMQIFLGVVIGCILTIFAWQIGGALAGLIAVVLYAFDPNFLAHAALVKNDVPITLVTLALVWTLWHIGRRANIWAIAALAMLSALTLTVKFSGIVLIPTTFALLAIRAVMPFEWPAAGRILTTRWSRLSFSIFLMLLMAIAAYLGTWASYGFRFRATSDGEPINTTKLLRVAAVYRSVYEMRNASWQQIREHAAQDVTDDWSTRLTNIALQHQLMPEAWLNGLLVTNEWAKVRPAYLCGNYSTRGWWYYFPLAALFKTPLATLIAAAALVVGFVRAPVYCARAAKDYLKTSGAWTVIAIAFPFSVYAAFALTSHLNLGIRHLLPLYPLGYLAVALGFSRLIEQWPRFGRGLGGILLVMLIVETLWTWPNYIAFFNAACGGARGGFYLLGDSNLDWGQDLPLLAKWQRDHPSDRMYLAFDKMMDPAAYGIRSTPLSEYSADTKPTGVPEGAPYIAINATILQKVYMPSNIYDELLKIEPTAVLGGSIYIWADNYAALNWLGALLMRLNRYPEAVAALDRAAQLQPTDALSHKNLASAFAGIGKTPEAIEQLRLAIKLDPNEHSAHNSLGVLLNSTGDLQNAAAEFERAIALYPNAANAQFNLAEVFRQRGEQIKTVEHYQIALRLQPKFVQVYGNLAKSLAVLDRAQEAVAIAQKGIEVARSSGQEAEAEKLEEWLTHYQIEVHRAGELESKSPPAPSTR